MYYIWEVCNSAAVPFSEADLVSGRKKPCLDSHMWRPEMMIANGERHGICLKRIGAQHDPSLSKYARDSFAKLRSGTRERE